MQLLCLWLNTWLFEGSKQKLSNGAKATTKSSERYGTRCATGSLKRKRYDRGFSDEEDELSPDESGKQTELLSANGRVRDPDSRVLNAATSSDSSTDVSSSDSESVSHQSSSGTEDYSEQSGPTQRPTRARTSGNGESRKLLRAQIADDSSQQSVESSSTRGKSARYSTRNQGRRTVRYQEDSDPDRGDAFLDHDQSDTDVEQSVSVSSRGRVRRPNPRVRTSLWYLARSLASLLWYLEHYQSFGQFGRSEVNTRFSAMLASTGKGFPCFFVKWEYFDFRNLVHLRCLLVWMRFMAIVSLQRMRPLNFEFVLTLVGSVSACSLIRFSYVATLSRFHYFIKRCSLVSHIHVKLRNIMSFQTDDAKQQKSVSCVCSLFQWATKC